MGQKVFNVKFLNYLYTYLESITEDLTYMNGYYLYNKPVSEINIDQGKIIGLDEYEILDFLELRSYLLVKQKYFLKKLNEKMKLKPKVEYQFITKPHDEYTVSIIDDRVDFVKKYREVTNGIVLLKKIVDRKESKAIKTLDDLNNQNYGLFTVIKGDFFYIVCYDYNLLIDYYKSEKDFNSPILFFGKILNRGSDLLNRQSPHGAAIVGLTAASQRVSGSNTLYPILTYFNNNKKIIPDRGSVSDDAEWVWRSFFNGKKALKKTIPIDDYRDPITPTKEDDGKLYYTLDLRNRFDDDIIDQILNDPEISNLKKEKFKEHIFDKNFNIKSNSDILKDKKMSDSEKGDLLNLLREEDPLNWVYELDKNEESKIGRVIDFLKQNHQRMKSSKKREKKIQNFESKLFQLGLKLFKKRAL